MKNVKMNKYTIWLFAVLFFFEQGFYLLPVSMGPLQTYDIGNILLLLLSAWGMFEHGITPVKKWNVFHYISLGMLILIIISAATAGIHWHQRFITTIFPQRYLIIIFFSYFTIYRLIEKNKMTIYQLFKTITVCAKAELIVFMVQFLMSFSNVIFLQCVVKTRYGLPRYYIDGTILMLFLIHEFVSITNGKFKTSSICWLGAALVFFLAMCQTRMIILGILVMIFMFFITWKTTIKRKILITIVFILVFAFLWDTPIFQDTLSLGGDESISANTRDIREEASLFYMKEMSKHPVFGLGYPNSVYADALRGVEYGYYLNDNGIFAFIYIYGGLGVLWLLMMYYNLIAKGWRIKEKKRYSGYFLYGIYTLAICISLIHWYWSKSSGLILVMVMCMEYYELKRINKTNFWEVL